MELHKWLQGLRKSSDDDDAEQDVEQVAESEGDSEPGLVRPTPRKEPLDSAPQTKVPVVEPVAKEAPRNPAAPLGGGEGVSAPRVVRRDKYGVEYEEDEPSEPQLFNERPAEPARSEPPVPEPRPVVEAAQAPAPPPAVDPLPPEPEADLVPEPQPEPEPEPEAEPETEATLEEDPLEAQLLALERQKEELLRLKQEREEQLRRKREEEEAARRAQTTLPLAGLPAEVEAPVQPDYEKMLAERDRLIQRLADPVLTLKEAADLLGVCTATVRRYTNKGVLPHFRTAGAQRRFRLSQVLKFMREHGLSLED